MVEEKLCKNRISYIKAVKYVYGHNFMKDNAIDFKCGQKYDTKDKNISW